MITGLAVRNLRALRDSGHVSVKKLNILVGMNSSGKSTLLRLFPLLRQSVEVRTKGPILWYGRLVDFGSLAEVRSEGASGEPVALSFDLELSRRAARSAKIVLKEATQHYRLPRVVGITLEIDKGANDSGFVSRVELRIGEDLVSVSYALHRVKSIEINKFKFEPSSDQVWIARPESKIPNVMFLHKRQGEDGGLFYSEDKQWVTGKVASHLRLLAHGNTSLEKLKLVATQLSYAPVDEFKRQVSGLTTAPESLRFELSSRDARGSYVAALRALLLLRVLPEVMQEVGERFEALGNGVRYIEPLRASVERYYRLQDLAVDEIDSSGANTAMYLHSLSPFEKRELISWMKENLGFYAFTESVGGNVEIKIVIGLEGPGRNVTDLGFGYSQILPVVLQLWHSYVRRPNGRQVDASVVAIEQPELHLHPRYQALLADVFARVCVSVEKQPRIVPIFVETHSEHLVNRLGELVAQGVIGADDVQIILFEKGEHASVVSSVGFDKEGVLEESWPLGLFIPEV